MSSVAFGNLLRNYRTYTLAPVLFGPEERPLTLERFAPLVAEALKKIDSISVGTVSNWENGKTTIRDRGVLLALIKVLKRYATVEGLRTPEQANDLLETGGYSSLNKVERDEIFPELTGDNPYCPPEASHVIGREKETEFLVKKLKREQMVILTGLAGVGKTSVAAKAAHQVDKNEKVFWYTLLESEDTRTLLGKLADFLVIQGGLNDTKTVQELQNSGQLTEYLDFIMQHIKGGKFLLCIDNFHQLEGDAPVDLLFNRLSLLVKTKGIKVLLVSRHHFLDNSQADLLAGLSEVDVHKWMNQAGIALSETEFKVLYETTGGNAQFLNLVFSHPKDSLHEHFFDKIARTPDVATFLLKTVDKGLSDGERQVMQAAALLLGYPIASQMLESLLDIKDFPATLARLHHRALLTRTDASGENFRLNSLIGNYYYNSMRKSKRQEMHGQAGNFYEKKAKDVFLATLHYSRAGNAKRALQFVSNRLEYWLNQGHGKALKESLAILDMEDLDPFEQARIKLALGYAQARIDEAQAAFQTFKDALALLDEDSSSLPVQELQAICCARIAEIVEYDSPQVAIKWLQNGLFYLDESISEVRALLQIKIGSMHIAIGNQQEALHATEAGLELLPTYPSPLLARAYINLGTIHATLGDIQEGMRHTEKGLKMCEESGDKFYLLTALMNLSIDYFIMGEWNKAVLTAEEALKKAEELPSINRQVLVSSNLGTMHLKRGEYAKAEKHLAKSEALSRKYNFKQNLPYILNSLTEMAIRNQNIENAHSLLDETEHVMQEIGAQSQLPEAYRLRALAFLVEEKLAQADEAIERSLKQANEKNMELESGISYRVQGQIRAAQGKLEEAVICFDKSYKILEDNDRYEAANTRAYWGAVLIKMGRVEQGKGFLKEALKVFTQLGTKGDWVRKLLDG